MVVRLALRHNVFVFGCAFLAGPSAVAQWRAISLHPDSAVQTWGHGTGSGFAGASINNGGATMPGLLAPSGSTIILAPPNASSGRVLHMRGRNVVGNVRISDVSHAALWTLNDNGNSVAFTDLHQPDATFSAAYGVGGGQQVGTVRYGDPNDLLNNRAALWRGSASSFVRLHPFGDWFHSDAYGTDGEIQAGHADNKACIWRGSASSFQLIHPAGASSSVALSAHSGRQGGWASMITGAGARSHAALWYGTAESFVDLHPAGARESQINDLFGDYQVGWAFWPTRKAVLWNGTAESAFDLNALLPADYSHSIAWGVEADEHGNLIVVGTAYNSRFGGRAEAVMWTYVVPEPASLAVLACRRLSRIPA